MMRRSLHQERFNEDPEEDIEGVLEEDLGEASDPAGSPQSGRSSRLVLWISLAVMIILGTLAVKELGSFLYKEEPLERADAVFALAGSQMERQLEAGDIYREGLAPVIVLSVEAPDGGVKFLTEHGIRYPSTAEQARNALVASGIPADAIVIPPESHDSTAKEARTLKQLATQYGWKRVIVVTSKLHTRRAGFAVRRELAGSGVDVIIRGSRYDPAQPARWWDNHTDMEMAGSEVQKLLVYLAGRGT